jgi:ParB/RepB/Spo0J family partition protein
MTDPHVSTDDQAPAPVASEPARKVCPACKTALLLSAFAKNATNPDGLQGTCRSCMREHRQNWYWNKKGKRKNTAETSVPAAETTEGEGREPAQNDREVVSGKGGGKAQAQERERESPNVVEADGQGVGEVSMAELPMLAVVASRTNPRKHFDAGFIKGLAESIRMHGLAQPILVRPLPGSRMAETYTDRRADVPRPTHEIIAGEQRFRAAQIAGMRKIPALIRHLDDDAVLQLQLVENLKRRDLHPMEEAEGYAQLRERLAMSVETIARRIEKSEDYVYNALKLLDLEPEAQEAFYAGELDRSVAELVAKRPPNLQIQLLREVTAKDGNGDRMSFRKARTLVETKYSLKLADAPFNVADPMLVPAAGACGPCPKRSGSQPLLFNEISGKDQCTDTECFATKKEAHYTVIRVQAEARGETVIVGKQAREIMPAPGKLIGYSRIDELQNFGGAPRTLREVLGDAMPSPTLVEDPQTRVMVAVLPTSIVGQLLKAQNIAKAEAKASAEDLHQQALERYESTWRLRAIERVRAVTEARIVGLGPEVLRIIAGMLLDTLRADQRRHVAKLLGLGPIGDLEGIQEAIARCEPGKLESLLLLLLIEHDVPQQALGIDGKGKPAPRLAAVAADLDVDLDAVRDEVRGEMREQLQPTPAKAPRKGKLTAAQAQLQIAEQLQAIDEPQASA